MTEEPNFYPYTRIRSLDRRQTIQGCIDEFKAMNLGPKNDFMDWILDIFSQYDPLILLNFDVKKTKMRLNEMGKSNIEIKNKCNELVTKRIIDLFCFFYCSFVTDQQNESKVSIESAPKSAITTPNETYYLTLAMCNRDREKCRTLAPKGYGIIIDNDRMIIQTIIDYAISDYDFDKQSTPDVSLERAVLKYRIKMIRIQQLMKEKIEGLQIESKRFQSVQKVQLCDKPSICYIVSPHRFVEEPQLERSDKLSEYHVPLPVKMGTLKEFIQTLLDTLYR